MPFIEAKSLTKNYNQNVHSGVSDINLEIDKGQIVSIIGESGSGKSTLLRLIYGTLEAQEGEVLFKGNRILSPLEKLIPGHDDMKMVTQTLDLNLYAKVYDNIASLVSNINLEEKKELTLQTMEFLRIDHLANKKVADLSGGEQQRVAIARAVITEPEVLLLDEPFSQIDAILKKQLREDVQRLAKYLNITVILVSHDPIDGLSMADNMFIIKNGRLVSSGKPSEIFYNPVNEYVARLLGRANIVKNLPFLPNNNQDYAVYPHHIHINKSKDKTSYIGRIKNIFFCGHYNEIEISYNNQTLAVYDYQLQNFTKGKEINFSIEKIITLRNN